MSREMLRHAPDVAIHGVYCGSRIGFDSPRIFSERSRADYGIQAFGIDVDTWSKIDIYA
jgi:hypothetical protein